MAQLVGVKSNFYIKTYLECNVVSDIAYLKNSNKIAIPKFKGYHIGWNQKQDNYFSLQKWIEGFHKNNIVTQVKDIITSEIREINTSDVKNISIE